MKPRIALLARSEQTRYCINQDYVKCLQDAGALVSVLTPQSFEDLEASLKTFDGLVIPGGLDVDPFRYHQPNSDSTVVSMEIDDLDIQATKIALDHNIEILGICRGLQVINVALGGTLLQDIEKAKPDALNHSFSTQNKAHMNGHRIYIDENSKLYDLLGSEIEVNSYHHQAIDQLADGLMSVASSYDGIIEAVESKRLMAVQWHPERMVELDIFQAFFEAFVERCKA